MMDTGNGSVLRDIRGLRRNRSGMPFASNRNQYNQRNNNTRNFPIYKSRRTWDTKSSDNSSSSSSSAEGITSRECQRNRLLGNINKKTPGMAEKYLYGRKARDDAEEGTESMHHSLARIVLSSSAGRNTKDENCPYRNPLFQQRYSKLIQDEENYVDETEYEDLCGICVATKSFRMIIKCCAIMLLSACFFVGLLSDGDYNLRTMHVNDHDGKYQSHLDQNQRIYEHVNVLSSFSNLTAAFNSNGETPFFLDIKLTGSTTVKRTLSKCFRLSMACELGLRQPHFKETELSVFPSIYQGYEGLYVNVDLSTKKGIQRAKDLSLTQSRLADVISMDMLYEGNDLFDLKSTNQSSLFEYAKVGADTGTNDVTKGRIFAMFAHPIDRAVAYYHYIKEATWDKDYDESVKEMTLLEFASSKYVEIDPMVGMLTNTNTDANYHYSLRANEFDLQVAKRILETKVLIGTHSDLEGSMARFQRYFGWDSRSHGNSNAKDQALDIAQADNCKRELIEVGDKWLTMQKESIKEGDAVWRELSKSLSLDLELYDHIEYLYSVQGEKIFEVVN